MKKENCVKLSLVINEWKKKPLLDLTFCISLVREVLFLSGKSQGILKRDVCGNHALDNMISPAFFILHVTHLPILLGSVWASRRDFGLQNSNIEPVFTFLFTVLACSYVFLSLVFKVDRSSRGNKEKWHQNHHVSSKHTAQIRGVLHHEADAGRQGCSRQDNIEASADEKLQLQ